jgi:hypothetical protein
MIRSHAIAAIEVCALGTVFFHKPFVCDHLIFEPVILTCIATKTIGKTVLRMF